ncbi:hypothetical protein BKA61DRAFT_738186 [Leptodontidium sp. MPI-SDFR-AT-0119]|nr:hypothetical protein BKA61DRAFT_738186 [Leptodontidium sp. MPI-SDFR-AT-0119]
MRPLTLLSALPFCAVAFAQQSTPFREYLVGYPDCATQCTLPVVDGLGYHNGSISVISTALCPDISSMRAISGCLQTNCSRADAAAAWPLQQNLCQGFPKPSKAPYIRNLTIIMALLAAVFVLLRCYSRTMVVKRFWWDDWNTAVAALFMIMIAVVMIWDSTIGLGLHAWDVDSPDNLVKIAKARSQSSSLTEVQVLLKVSILLFYLRVFPVPWIQVVTWILIAITLLHGVAFFFAILFQCTPVAMLWNPHIQGNCIQLETIIFPGAIFSILEDLAILLLPIPCLSKLSVGRGKKISLICMFSVGTIACVISIIRVKPVIFYRDTLDQSWDAIHLLAWSEAELTVATICVCLPSLKPILNYHVPRYFSASSSRGFVVGNLSPEPPTSGDRDLINSVGSENKRNWLGSRLTFKSLGTFGKSSKQMSEGSDFVSGSAAREEGIANENERRGWRENSAVLPEGRGTRMSSRGSQMPRSPRGVLAGSEETRISVDRDRDRDPWMDRVKRIRHLSEATYDSSIPRSATGSRADGRLVSMSTVQDQPNRLSEAVERVQSSAKAREVPIFLDENNSSRIGQAGSYEEGSDAASSETGSGGRSWRSWSWHGGAERVWRISSVRVSRFRISAFERRSDDSSLAETREEV